MFLGLNGGRDRDQNAGTCWTNLQMGFKMLFVTSIVLCLLSYILSSVFLYFPNIVVLTVQKLQLWRLFTSFMLPGIGSFAIINVLFDFYILYQFLPDIEKKFSTAYVLLEVLMQIFLCNCVLVMIGYPLYLLGLGDEMSYIGFGMLPAVFVFIWKKVAEAPDEGTRFCCFPCLIPMRYIPLCFLGLLLLFGQPPVPLLISCALGYYQFMVRKASILRLPLKVYRKVDSIMPTSLKDIPGYVKVANSQANIKTVCLTNGCCDWGQNEEAEAFRGGNEGAAEGNSNQADRVEVIGGGVAIGGGAHSQPQNSFKNHWKDKELQQQHQTDKPKSENEQNVKPSLASDDHFQQYFDDNGNPTKKANDSLSFDNQSIMSDKPLQ